MFFVAVSRYVGSLADIDVAMPDHLAYLDEQYRSASFLLSGPQTPRRGGIILAQAESREAMVAILERDPFKVRGLIEYELTGWNLNRRNEALPRAVFPNSRTLA